MMQQEQPGPGTVQFAMLTAEQVADIVARAIEATLEAVNRGAVCANLPEPEREKVYGYEGIRRLFNVGVSKAWQLKRDVLGPAIVQDGRHIEVDVQRARELYEDYCRRKGNASLCRGGRRRR